MREGDAEEKPISCLPQRSPPFFSSSAPQTHTHAQERSGDSLLPRFRPARTQHRARRWRNKTCESPANNSLIILLSLSLSICRYKSAVSQNSRALTRVSPLARSSPISIYALERCLIGGDTRYMRARAREPPFCSPVRTSLTHLPRWDGATRERASAREEENEKRAARGREWEAIRRCKERKWERENAAIAPRVYICVYTRVRLSVSERTSYINSLIIAHAPTTRIAAAVIAREMSARPREESRISHSHKLRDSRAFRARLPRREDFFSSRRIGCAKTSVFASNALAKMWNGIVVIYSALR